MSPPADEPPLDAERLAQLLRIARGYCAMVPHNHAIGMEVVEALPGRCTLRVPYDARLAGDPDTGVLHGGVITTLMDATLGMSVFSKTTTPVPLATLDLRIDYLRPAVPGAAVTSRGECYKLTRNVGFARAIAYHDDPDDPIAAATGTFMMHTAGAPAAQERRPAAPDTDGAGS